MGATFGLDARAKSHAALACAARIEHAILPTLRFRSPPHIPAVSFIVLVAARSRVRFEKSEVRRRLALLGRHQEAVRAQIVGMLADFEDRVAFLTHLIIPNRTRILAADGFLVQR